MAYVTNPARAQAWLAALEKGVAVFSSLKEQTKKEGFTLDIMKKIMEPVWPCFEPFEQEEIDEFLDCLTYMYKGFWKRYAQISEGDQDQDYTPEEAFKQTLGLSLDDCHVYEHIIVKEDPHAGDHKKIG